MLEIKEERHISEETWEKLAQNSISQQEYLKILKHTCECSWCAEHLALSMEQEDLLQQPPAYLKEEIMLRSAQADVQIPVTIKRTSKKIQMMIYSLKVGLAIVVSVFILGIVSNVQEVGFTHIEKQRPMVREETLIDRMNDKVNGITNKITEFSNFILDGGGIL